MITFNLTRACWVPPRLKLIALASVWCLHDENYSLQCNEIQDAIWQLSHAHKHVFLWSTIMVVRNFKFSAWIVTIILCVVWKSEWFVNLTTSLTVGLPKRNFNLWELSRKFRDIKIWNCQKLGKSLAKRLKSTQKKLAQRMWQSLDMIHRVGEEFKVFLVARLRLNGIKTLDLFIYWIDVPVEQMENPFIDRCVFVFGHEFRGFYLTWLSCKSKQ